MSLKQQIDADLKTAMLAGEKTLVTTLRGLKSAILNVEVAEGSRDTGLSDESVIDVLGKEAKKRQDSADMYHQAHEDAREQAELEEKKVIEKYLPQQMSDEELASVIDKVITDQGGLSPQTMGKIIGGVKQETRSLADGARIAAAVKIRLENK